jgi:hypothetical protein
MKRKNLARSLGQSGNKNIKMQHSPSLLFISQAEIQIGICSLHEQKQVGKIHNCGKRKGIKHIFIFLYQVRTLDH